MKAKDTRSCKRSDIETLEHRRLLAFVAAMFGTQVTLIDGGNTHIEITRDVNGKLFHNRFLADDPGFVSSYDFDSVFPGVQALNAGASTVIKIQTSSSPSSLHLNDTARSTGGTYWIYSDFVTLPDGTRIQYDSAIDHLTLFSSNKSDDINIRSTSAAWGEDFYLYANNGNDRIDLGPTGSMDDLRANSTLSGGSGDDTIYFHDEGDTSTGNVYSCNGVSTQRSGIPDTKYDGIEGLHLQTTEQADDVLFTISNSKTLTLDTNGGADEINIDSIAFPQYTSAIVDSGSGNDTIDVDKTGSGHHIDLTAGSGSDTLRVRSEMGQPCEVALTGSDILDTLDVDYSARLTFPVGAAAFVVVNDLSAKGRIDLLDASLIVRSPSNLSSIQSALLYGFANGAWTGNANNGGICSTTAAQSPIRDGVGYCTAALAGVTTYAGIGVNANDLIIDRTLMGDTNMDHAVDFDDLLTVVQNYGKQNKHWFAGNFDFDPISVVNFADLLIVAQNYGSNQFSAASPTKVRPHDRAVGLLA